MPDWPAPRAEKLAVMRSGVAEAADGPAPGVEALVVGTGPPPCAGPAVGAHPIRVSASTSSGQGPAPGRRPTRLAVLSRACATLASNRSRSSWPVIGARAPRGLAATGLRGRPAPR